MLRTLTKGRYLRCCKYKYGVNQLRNIYSLESSFLCRGKSTTHFNHKKAGQTNRDRYFDETMEVLKRRRNNSEK